MKKITEPLAGDYTVIYNHYDNIPMEDGYVLTDAPSIVKTSQDELLCAVPLQFRGTPKVNVKPLLFFLSEDNGETWNKLPVESEFCSGTLFKLEDTIYFIGAGPVHRKDFTSMRIIRSRDDGRTWTEPVDIFKGGFYQPAGSYVIKNGQFYWCCDIEREKTFVIAGDINKNLINPDSWRISDAVCDPGVPPTLTSGEGSTRLLEGNVVEVGEKMRVLWRYMIDGRSTVGIGIICDLEDDGEILNYEFSQFYPLPGAQNQLNIVYDDKSELYWMTANLPTRSQDEEFAKKLKENPRYQGGPGKERRILTLYCSFDALNWLPAGYVIVWPLVRQASNYCGLLIDDEDLMIVCRTSKDGRNQHDNDLTTFHRVEKFRELAKPLYPQKERT